MLAEHPPTLPVLLLLGEPVPVINRFLLVALDPRFEVRVPLIPDLFVFNAYLPIGAHVLR